MGEKRMQEIELPFMPGDTGLYQAFEALRSSGLHAVVTERCGEPFVLRADELTERWNALADAKQDPAATQLTAVVPRAAPAVLPDRLAGLRPDTGLLGHGDHEAEISEMFHGQDARYAVRVVLGDVAKVITASERFAGTLLDGRSAGTGLLSTIVRCEGPTVHYWESSELRDPNYCNKPHKARIIR